MLIHPDKLPNFADATRAFQVLVTALDLTQAQIAGAAAAPGYSAQRLLSSVAGVQWRKRVIVYKQ